VKSFVATRRKQSRKSLSKLPRKSPRTPHREQDAGKWFENLVALQARLRGPGGCPWDREQTHESLRKFLVEETYEVLDAMESGDPNKFASELGDLLLQVVFHALLAEEAGKFTIADVIEAVHTKMVRRHPHVFGKVKARTSAAVLKNWEQLKAAERTEGTRNSGDVEESILAGVPRSLPAVLEAHQLASRASHIGFDWENVEGIFEKLVEEMKELREATRIQTAGGKAASPTVRIEEEAGDLLAAAVNIARFLGVDPEIALKKANRKFKRRFEWMEHQAAREGRRLADVPRERMEELWNDSKTAAHERNDR